MRRCHVIDNRWHNTIAAQHSVECSVRQIIKGGEDGSTGVADAIENNVCCGTPLNDGRDVPFVVGFVT